MMVIRKLDFSVISTFGSLGNYPGKIAQGYRLCGLIIVSYIVNLILDC